MSLQKRNRFHLLDRRADIDASATTGISLHCHTLYSKEMLDFVPYYASSYPVISSIWRRECGRYFREQGRMPNFDLGYWEPPLTARQVYDSEKQSLEQMGLEAIVSITDHDSIQAGLDLRTEGATLAPISLEWTVPFHSAYFHVGVHNLPADRAEEISKQLLDFTFAAADDTSDGRLCDLLSLLNEDPEILVVLNHPVWDIELIGQAKHDRALKEFLIEFGHWMHALEINGFRPWSENQAVIEIAERTGLPLISGGDRHCLGRNTMINTSGAVSFAEFVDEVRNDKYSSIVVLPEYHQPLVFRQVRSIAQILAYYADFPADRRHWSQRVFFDAEDGQGPLPLSTHWSGRGPRWHEWGIGVLAALGHRAALPLFRLAEAKTDAMPETAVGFAVSYSRLVKTA